MTKINKYIPYPGITLQETLECVGMSQAELAMRISRPIKTISEIVNGKAVITPDTAIQLERALGIQASFWNNLEKNYQEKLARKAAEEKILNEEINYFKNYPYSGMVKNGWIQKANSILEKIEILLAYFRVNSLKLVEVIHPEVAYKKTKTKNLSSESLTAWLRKGEIDAERIETKIFDKELLLSKLESLRKLTINEKAANIGTEMQKICAECGIALVFTPYLKNSCVCGATKWINTDKALVQLSLRGKFNDIFWFSFFHELGHILYGGKRNKFIDIKDQVNIDEEEIKADNFATNILIPSDKYKQFIDKGKIDRISIQMFAKEVAIHTGIIVGRLQHDKLLDYSQGNDLRQKYSIK